MPGGIHRGVPTAPGSFFQKKKKTKKKEKTFFYVKILEDVFGSPQKFRDFDEIDISINAPAARGGAEAPADFSRTESSLLKFVPCLQDLSRRF